LAQGKLADARCSTGSASGCGHARHAEVLDCAVDYSLELVGVFDFAALGQDHARSFCVEPGWVAVVFLGLAGLADFHEEGFDYVFLHAAGMPEDALGVDVDVEVVGLDDAGGSGFFLGLRSAAWLCERRGSGAPLGNVHLLPPLVWTSRNSACEFTLR